MNGGYAPALRPRGAPELRCGHTDCRYCTLRTDSCDYLLIEFRRRGCPPTPDCSRYTPRAGLRGAEGERLAARLQAYEDMGLSVGQIAQRLGVCEPSLRRFRAAAAGRGGNLKKCKKDPAEP